jgi:ATP-binding cassette subfamily B protein
MLGLLVFTAIGQYTQAFLSGWLGQQIIHDIRVQLYEKILSLRMRFFDNTQVGRLITRNISDVETLADVFSEGLAAMSGDLLQIVFILSYMLYLDWKLTLVSMSTLPFLILSTYIFKEKIKSSFNDVRSAVANLNSFVQEQITGMSIVQIFGVEKREFEKFRKINEEHKKANIRSVLYYSIYFPVAEIVGAVSVGLLIWYGVQGIIDSHTTLGTLIAFNTYIAMFFRPIRAIADRFNTLQLGIVSTERIIKLLDSDEFIPDTGTLAPKHIKGSVDFNDVWFAYKDDDYVLKGISFHIAPGEKVAFVGATGAGKTSVMSLLCRFYEYNKGQIAIDGIPIEHYSNASLRQHIGVVLQDVFLFSGSIYDNITLGNNDITKEQVQEAARIVGAHEFIMQLPGDYDYNVMERGATLSVGQRQLISFIRALVYKPAIIIMDEATSSVDTDTEDMIQNAIAKMMEGRTAIIIAHRLSSIQKADRIYVMDKGKIAEVGTHDELLVKKGLYANLYEMQFLQLDKSSI